MFRKPVDAIIAAFIFALLMGQIAACSPGTGLAVPGGVTGVSGKESAAVPWVELKRRNWENNGTDTQIESDGTYSVSAVYMRTRKEVRTGRISQADLHELTRQIEDARLFELSDKFSAPFKSEWSWWGYVLTVKTERGAKTIRFHSEDDTVPENLKRIVDMIMKKTK
jgi:hypothetical protein